MLNKAILEINRLQNTILLTKTVPSDPEIRNRIYLLFYQSLFDFIIVILFERN